MKKEEDKRLIIPKDAFEEEASEGLGKLNKEEAAEDLRELKERMERRVRKPRMIWLPAAAAVVILLVASTVYIALFRDRNKPETEIAMTETAITDTALIAMAQPITVTETKSAVSLGSAAGNQDAGNAPAQAEKMKSARAEYDMAAADDEAIAVMEVMEEEAAADDVVFRIVQEEVTEEVVVQAVPQMTKAAMKARAETVDRATAPVTAGKKDVAQIESAGRKEAAVVDAATEGRNDAAAAVEAGAGVGMPDRESSPVGGWNEYREWVARNISYPDGIAPAVRQEVMVSITVRPDSSLYELKAVRSPGEAFTREAFRLLHEGPKWIPAIEGGKVMSDEVVLLFVFK